MMTWSEEKQELTKMTLAVAAALGPPWKAVAPEENDRPTDDIANGNGASLYLNIDRHKKRVKVGGSMHFQVNGRTQYVQLYPRFEVPGITVAMERGPEAVAKEINRRLLPDYLKAVELAKAQVAKQNETTERKQANIRKLVAACDGRLPEFDKYPEASHFYLGKRSGTVHVNYDESVNFERLGVSMEEAEYILKYLYGNRNNGGAA